MGSQIKTIARAKPLHHNVIAHNLRLERVELFARIAQAEKALRVMLKTFSRNMSDTVNDKATKLANLKVINEKLHTEIVVLRSSMRSWMIALIRDAVKMGFRHPGNALKPIFKDNQKRLTEMERDQMLFEARVMVNAYNLEELFKSVVAFGIALSEDRLSFGMDDQFANQAKPTVKTSSAKWVAAGQRIIKNVAKKNLQGLTVSERIWDLTSRTEADLKRLIANGIAQGNSPYRISKQIEKYVAPGVGAADELGIQTGPGVYRSAYKNAMRLARTETNRAYTQATASFAAGKPWIDGMQITLSPNHDVEDECDDLAAMDPVSPEEFADLIPAHPHCMCTGTFVINPKYLGQEDDDNASTQTED